MNADDWRREVESKGFRRGPAVQALLDYILGTPTSLPKPLDTRLFTLVVDVLAEHAEEMEQIASQPWRQRWQQHVDSPDRITVDITNWTDAAVASISVTVQDSVLYVPTEYNPRNRDSMIRSMAIAAVVTALQSAPLDVRHRSDPWPLPEQARPEATS